MAENLGSAQRGRQILRGHRELRVELERINDHRLAVMTEGARKVVAKINAEIDLKAAQEELDKAIAAVSRLELDVSRRTQDVDKWKTDRDNVEKDRSSNLKEQEDMLKELTEVGNILVEDEDDVADIPILIEAGVECEFSCCNGFICSLLNSAGHDYTLINRPRSITSKD